MKRSAFRYHGYFSSFRRTVITNTLSISWGVAELMHTTVGHGGGANTPVGHWRSSFKTGTPTIYFLAFQFLSTGL